MRNPLPVGIVLPVSGTDTTYAPRLGAGSTLYGIHGAQANTFEEALTPSPANWSCRERAS